jgi:hypothetical protein
LSKTADLGPSKMYELNLLIAYERLREEKDITSDAYVIWMWPGHDTNNHVHVDWGYDIIIH